jgi:hypothetical protein
MVPSTDSEIFSYQRLEKKLSVSSSGSEDGTDRLSRNVVKQLSLFAA